MTIMAIVSVADMAEANKRLADLGHGLGNFSRAMTSDGQAAQYAGLSHVGNDPVFEQHVRDLVADLAVTIGEPNDDFAALAQRQGLDWEAPESWIDGLPMKGDTREQDGKVWVSQVDFNVWPIPIGWREDAEHPQWVRPTGSADAYSKGATVTFEGQVYRSLTDANVWTPTEYRAGWELVDVGGGSGEWQAGVTYATGDVVTYEGSTFECVQGHTAQVGWEPPAQPALWTPA